MVGIARSQVIFYKVSSIILRLRPCRRPLYFGFCRFVAVSLVAGCSFDVTRFTIRSDSGADVVSFGAQNMSFAMLVAPNLAPWRTIERFRGTWEHKKGDLGVLGLDFYLFGEDFGTGIWDFSANFKTEIVFFGMRVCRSRF